MLKRLLAGALGVLLTVVPLQAQATTDCVGGRARGGWDLPVKDQLGRVRGLLGDGNGHRLLLQARLTPGGADIGRIDGVLTPMTATGPADKPIAEVHGVYYVGLDRRGRFETVITELAGVLPEPPPAIGKLAGAFADPMVNLTDPIGRFTGLWTICR
jgi:hypothetical protein